MAFPAKLSGDKLYHCSIYYNYFEGNSSGRDPDHRLSYDFLCLLENKLGEIGMTKLRYYDNLPPGVNLFDELFSNMLEQAEKIVVLFTKGFQDNHWHKLIHQSNFKELLDRKESKNLLGISVGMRKSDISKDFGMCVQNLVYFADDWRNDDNSWEKIVRFFFEEGIVNERMQRSTSNLPVQESGGRVDSIEVDGAAADDSIETDSHEAGEDGVNDSIESDEAEGTDSERQNADETDSHEVGEDGVGDSIVVDGADGPDSERLNPDGAAEDPHEKNIQQRKTNSDEDDIPLRHDASISVQESLKEKKNTPGFLGKFWDAYSWLCSIVTELITALEYL